MKLLIKVYVIVNILFMNSCIGFFLGHPEDNKKASIIYKYSGTVINYIHKYKLQYGEYPEELPESLLVISEIDFEGNTYNLKSMDITVEYEYYNKFPTLTFRYNRPGQNILVFDFETGLWEVLGYY